MALALLGCAGAPPTLDGGEVSTVTVTTDAPARPTATPIPEDRIATRGPADALLDGNVEPMMFAPPGSRSGPTPKMRTVTAVKLVKKWQTKVGLGTFRTTMAMVGGSIVVGTHGSTLGGTDENDDGVYVLEAAIGRIQRFIATPESGDRDVGGIAVDGDAVFFTGDASMVASASLTTGAIRWTTKLGGKVRPAPALAELNGDGAVDVVVGDETGTLWALDGKRGSPIWSVKTGQNEYGAEGFVGAAAIVDVDGDGKDDVVAGARDGVLSAYRGKDGRTFWSVKTNSGMHASPQVVDLDGDGRREILAAWSYSDLGIFDAKTGSERQGQSLSLDQGGIEGLFSTPVPLPTGTGSGTIAVGSAWWGADDGITVVGVRSRLFRSSEGRTTSSAVVADLNGDGVPEAIWVTEAGKLVSVTAAGQRAELAKIAGQPETTPMLADVDGDGTLELLVLDGRGELACYLTRARGPALVSRFRGDDPRNRGELSVRMDFELVAPSPGAVRSGEGHGDPLMRGRN